MKAQSHLSARVHSNVMFMHEGDTTFVLTLIPLTAYCPNQADADKLTNGTEFGLLISTGQCRTTEDRARIARIEVGDTMTFELEGVVVEDDFIRIENLVSVKPSFKF